MFTKQGYGSQTDHHKTKCHNGGNKAEADNRSGRHYFKTTSFCFEISFQFGNFQEQILPAGKWWELIIDKK